jgi:hypothetical protein
MSQRTVTGIEPMEPEDVVIEVPAVKVVRAWGPRGPRGFTGPPGAGVEIVGTVSTSTQLPMTADVGDTYFVEDTGHLWIWANDVWNDAGPLQGPEGPPGEVSDPLVINELRTNTIRWGLDASGPTITYGSGAPNSAQPAGSLYVRTGTPGTAGQRLYWNANGASGGWVAIDNQEPPGPSRHVFTSGTTTGALSVPTTGPYVRIRGRMTTSTVGPLNLRFNGDVGGHYWSIWFGSSGSWQNPSLNYISVAEASADVNAAAFDLTIWRLAVQRVQMMGETWDWYESVGRRNTIGGVWVPSPAVDVSTVEFFGQTFVRLELDIWSDG